MLRGKFDQCMDDSLHMSYAINSRVEAGEIIGVDQAWSQTIDFPKPKGTTAYLASPVDSLLGVLPFYDFVYVPILSGYLYSEGGVKDQDDFRHLYQVDTRYFLELVDAGKVIPVFDESKGSFYSDFIVDKLWTYLYTRQRPHLYLGQLHSIGTAFQSVSQIKLPWHDPTKSPWWTEMMIYGCALNGRTIGSRPKDLARFMASKSDFDNFLLRAGSPPFAIDGTRLDLIAGSVGLYCSPHVSVSKYLEILDSRVSKTLRDVFENTTTLERSSDDTILDALRQYNALIEDIARSKKYKLLRISSDLFTKHVLSVSLAVGGALVGDWPLGLAGLILGGVADQMVKLIDDATAAPLQTASRGLTEALSKVFGVDSNMVHLVMLQEKLKNL